MSGDSGAKIQELLGLLSAESKADARHLARVLRITKRALATLIKDSVTFGLHHRFIHHDHVPEGRVEKLETFWKDLDDPQRLAKATRNLSSLFKERKYFMCHLFEPIAFDRHGEWHMFYFSQHDLSPFGNHWREGEHLHYTSYLYAPRMTAGHVLQAFEERKHESVPAEHIRTVRFYTPGQGGQSG